MDKVYLGIETNISSSVLELALSATLNGSASSNYFLQLARSGCKGENRARKSALVINRVTLKNRLLPKLLEEKEAVLTMLQSSQDKPILLTSIMCAEYPVFYDVISILGKYFHVQELVNRQIVMQKLGESYPSNRSFFKAYDSVIPMLIDFGMIARPQPALYKMIPQRNSSTLSQELYKKAFLIYNPLLSETDDFMSHPFFEFVR